MDTEEGLRLKGVSESCLSLRFCANILSSMRFEQEFYFIASHVCSQRFNSLEKSLEFLNMLGRQIVKVMKVLLVQN